MIFLEIPCLDGSLRARAEFVGGDLWVLVSGGQGPHVGSVCLAVPRPSLSGDGTVSSTVSTINAVGHKDDFVGAMFAARLSAVFDCRVSVSCGIHFEGPGPEDVRRVMRDAESLLESLAASLKRKQVKT